MADSLYITNYCDKRCSPFQNITRLPRQEAYALAKNLSIYKSDTFTSFSRFCDEDFDGYYKKRIRTEEWLYESFLSIGGRPKNKSPLYFVLGESSYLKEWYANGLITKILLNDIDIEDVSFTYGDSMSKMDSKERMQPFNKETLFDYISRFNNNILSFLDQLNELNRYIEVQLWNDIYVRNNL